jgi:hypothetical protein
MDKNNENYSSVDGSLFNKSKDILIRCSGEKSGTYVIPDGVISIADGAFSGCVNIKNIDIPDEVTSIGERVFEACDKLESIGLPKGITTLKTRMFWGCNNLGGIELPDTINSIESDVFWGCVSLEDIELPEGITELSSGLFSSCRGLKSFTLPEGITEIPERLFYDCTSLKSIAIPESVKRIYWGAFTYCTSLEDIIIPDTVENVAKHAFYGTAWYQNQPDGMIYTGKVAYEYKGEMEEEAVVRLREDIVSIGEAAFSNCIKLRGVHIPNGVKQIGDSAFKGCKSLVNVTLPESVKEIGVKAFYQCEELKSITFPKSIKKVEEYAFEGCGSITDVYYTGTEAEWDKVLVSPNNLGLRRATMHYNAVASMEGVQYEINSIAALENQVVVNITNRDEAVEGHVIVVALFDAKNCFGGAVTQEIFIERGQTQDVLVDMYAGSNTKIKVLVWDGIQTMVPMSKKVEKTVGPVI